MVINALQSQIDSLTSTVALLMDKFDQVEHRTLLAEQRVSALMENRDNQHSTSTFEHKKRSSSMLRHNPNKSIITNEEMRNEFSGNFEAVCDRIDELQIQIDRVDGKLIDIR